MATQTPDRLLPPPPESERLPDRGKVILNGLRASLSRFGVTAGATLGTWRELSSPVRDPVRAAFRCVSPTGWTVVAAAAGAWLVGWALGWQESMYAAATLAALLTFCALLAIGRTSLEVAVRVQPGRVTAGTAAAAEVAVHNTGRASLLPVPLDLCTGETVTRFHLPALLPGGRFQDIVVLPTDRRGVYVIGPAKTQRGDPFGLIRREIAWTKPQELFVHPHTVTLRPLGTGRLPDLEGQPSNDVSVSDLAFHTLREYAPGDDRRHIHWLSSARRSEALASDQFMVRQFLHTRRSHVAVVVDCHSSSWLDPDEFETALSAGASIVRRCLQDGNDVSEACGLFTVTLQQRHTALDLFSRARLGAETVDSVAGRLARTAHNVSAAVIISGALTPFQALCHAARGFSTDATALGLRIEHGAPVSLRRSSGLTVVTLGSLADLPRALAQGVLA
jgi:uncharacterized protein (DUF58 family)